MELTVALKALSDDDQLTLVDSQLLEEVVLAWHRGSTLQVKDVISLEKIASRATLHKWLQRLQTLGYVVAQQHQDDLRSKILEPTELALRHYGQLGSILLKVAKPHG